MFPRKTIRLRNIVYVRSCRNERLSYEVSLTSSENGWNSQRPRHLTKEGFLQHGQCSQSYACCTEDRVAYGGSEAYDRGLAGPGGGLVFAVDDFDVYLGNVAEAWDAVFAQAGIQYFPILEMDGFEQCSADGLHYRS